MDLEAAVQGMGQGLMTRLKEEGWCQVPRNENNPDDRQSPIFFKDGALAIVEVSPGVMSDEPGARVIPMCAPAYGADGSTLPVELLRPGVGWEQFLADLDKQAGSCVLLECLATFPPNTKTAPRHHHLFIIINCSPRVHTTHPFEDSLPPSPHPRT
jgi:hypothetical protein